MSKKRVFIADRRCKENGNRRFRRSRLRREGPRGSRAQPRSRRRGGGQGGVGLSQAARGRQGLVRLRRQPRRRHQVPDQGRRVLARRPGTDARGRTPALVGLLRPLVLVDEADDGRAGEARRRGRPARQALRRSRLEREPVLRLHQAGLPDHQPLGGRPHRARRRASTRTPARRPASTSSRSPTRSPRRTSSSPTRSSSARRFRPMPRTWCAACTCSPRTSRPAAAISRSARPAPATSGSARTSPPRPARSSTRTSSARSSATTR